MLTIMSSCTITSLFENLGYGDQALEVVSIEVDDMYWSTYEDKSGHQVTDIIYHYKVTLKHGNTYIVVYTNSKDYRIGDVVTVFKAN